MNPDWLFDGCVAALLCSLLTWALVLVAERVNWTDDGQDAPGRKLQSRAVPLVGGVSLIIVLFLWEPWTTCLRPWLCLPRELEDVRVGYGAAALIGAFLIGLIDDAAPQGIRPAVKFAGQAAVAILCARHVSPMHGIEGLAEGVGAGLLALLAMNAFNTFDNADGAATALGVLGAAPVVPVLAAAVAGFLPFNLWLRRKAPDGSSTPLAYLGDAGSHLLGVLVALVPGAWPVLALPLLDLARLSVVRIHKGSRPWIGDRRHLAHRLQARGLGPTAVVGVLLLVAAPSIAAGAFSRDAAWALPAGLLGTAVLFLAALRWTPDRP